MNPYHYTHVLAAIRERQLADLDPTRITLEVCLQAEPGGNNVFHNAAYFQQLKYIPQEFITQDLLLHNLSQAGSSLLYEAGCRGCLDQIPVEFITAYNLLHHKGIPHSALYITAINNHLGKIPITPDVVAHYHEIKAEVCSATQTIYPHQNTSDVPESKKQTFRQPRIDAAQPWLVKLARAYLAQTQKATRQAHA